MAFTRLQTPAAKPKGRGKLSPKIPTPKKAVPRKRLQPQSPIGEVTTTSDYFASSNKSKTTRSTPAKPKAVQSTNERAVANTTPESKTASTSNSARKGRTSARAKAKPKYAELSGDGDNTPTANLDDDSGEDIHHADYKRSGRKMEDDYQSDSEEEEHVKPTRKSRKRGTQTSQAREERKIPVSGDVDMKDAGPSDDFVVPDAEERIISSKPVNGLKARGRKRKSAEVEVYDDDANNDTSKPRAKNTSSVKDSPTKKPTAKKARTSTKEPVVESKGMQDIFDKIPLIRPPTPPARDADKKFDFRNGVQNSQPAPGAGTKEPPTGAENCLAGLTFVFTGLLDTLGREEGQELVKRYGGKVTTSPSSKTSYVVLGNEAGPKKLETIAKFKLKTINEDGLYELIRLLPANGGDSTAAEKFAEKQRAESKKIQDMAEQMEREEKSADGAGATKNSTGTPTKSATANSNPVDSRLWTVKYAPTTTSQICGNKGQVQKLQAWLRAWRSNARTKFKKAGADGHGSFRAVIIHGPPGIGKTTAAHLTAKLEGYDVVESNASDTRSKKMVENGLKGVMDTTSILGYFSGDGKRVDEGKKKLVLIMDEVDGMSAGDRGGVGALAAVCKKTNIPIILICNERRLPKLKPFDHVAYDLPFRKPTIEQVRGRIMTILYREGMKDMIPPNVVNALIEGSRADIRQIINMISTAKVDQQALDFDSGKQMSNAWEKHVILKTWDIVNKILAGGMFSPSSTSTLDDKIQLYFNDHELSSLFLQENYLGTSPILSTPYAGRERNLKVLELAEKAAASISDGDLVDRMIHGSQQHWTLMPTHAVFSFVRPASFMSGSMAGHGQTRFPTWLGNNSKQSKLVRLVKEIQGHMRLRSSGDRHEIRQQYLPVLWYRLVHELESRGKDHVEDIITFMDSYFLTKDDWDAIQELGVGPMAMEEVKIDTQTKSAFTRTYNIQSHPLPFMKASNIVAPKQLTRERPDLEEALDESDDVEEVAEVEEADDEEPLDLKKDKYVQAPKKRKAAAKKAPIKKGAGKGKGKGRVESEEGEEVEEDSEEDVGPQKGKGRAKAGPARGRGKK
ncbi:MAG: hypothetical protein Q9187_000173 [Circinaria calcarea]